jgi:hypothetical protein
VLGVLGGGYVTRHRRTNAEIEAFDSAVHAIAERVQPATCRQIYYRAVVADLVAKDDRGYRLILESLSRQRWAGSVPWDWISDETRAVRAPEAWESAGCGLGAFAATYRRDAWRGQPAWPEIWAESDSLAGTLVDVTWDLGLPLFSGRGFASLTAIRSAAVQIRERWQERDQPTVVLYVGDLDPAGWSASRAAHEGLHRHLVDLEMDDGEDCLEFVRLAVNPIDVEIYDLPTGRPPKLQGPGSSAWWDWDGPRLDYTVEAEAFEPATLRRLVREVGLRLADVEALRRAWDIEEMERETLRRVAEAGLFTELGRYADEVTS